MVMKTGTDGADTLVGTDDNDTLQGLGGDDQLTGGPGADVLDGGDGIDTVLYDNAGAGVSVDLLHHRGLNGEAFGDSLLNIENVSGSAFGDNILGDDQANVLRGHGGDDHLTGYGGDDMLVGGTGDDRLAGGAGADILDGGDGVDTADYSSAAQAVGVILATHQGFAGEAQGDTYRSIENVVGSAFDDAIFGDNGANVLSGLGGDDVLLGGGGNDTIVGGAGNDRIAGGAGADDLDAGDGIDTLDYSASADGLIVQLLGNHVSGGDGLGDTITGFENVIGSAQGDGLFGDAGANRLFGGGGDDTVVGLGGDDVIAGGAGADELSGGDGIDTLDYRGSAAGVFVNLATGQVAGGDAEGDLIAGFENVTGSAQDDELSGDGGANRLSGGAGRDFLVGGLGRDQLTGGTGADRFSFFSTAESGKTAATRDVIHDFHHGQGDRLALVFDANVDKPGMQTLSFIGHKAFTAPGQVRSFFEGDHTVVEVNTAGHSGAEMQIQLDHHVNLAKGDFIFDAGSL